MHCTQLSLSVKQYLVLTFGTDPHALGNGFQRRVQTVQVINTWTCVTHQQLPAFSANTAKILMDIALKIEGKGCGWEKEREKAKSELWPVTSTSWLNAKFIAQTISKEIPNGQALFRLWNRKTRQDIRIIDICPPKHSLCPPKAKYYSKYLLP